MGRLEGVFERECILELRTLPRSYWPDKAPSGAIRGLPDRVGCIAGKYIALEFKRSEKDMGSRRERLQKYVLHQTSLAGGIGYFVAPENWDDVYKKLKEIACEP